MKPLIYSNVTPSRLENFNIGWDNLVLSGMNLEKAGGISYLEHIEKYCNNGGFPQGINVKVFEFRTDPEFDKALELLHGLPFVQEEFITALFTKTDIRNHLREFAATDEVLTEKITAAKFTFLNAFHIEAELSYFLYRYGMYNHFWQNHTAAEAEAHARSLTQLIYKSDPGNVVCFTTHSSWGEWFDVHSCSDYTFVLINKTERTLWLLCFSHSD